MLRYFNLFAIFWQFVSSCRGRFIVPTYSYTSTKCGMKMRVRWNKCTYFMKRIYIFDNVRIRARWICPYAWRGVRCEFRWWELCICGLFVVCFVVWMLRYSNLFAIFWQFVSSRRGRFIVPAYPYTPTKYGMKMRVRWNKCTYFMKRIYIFDNVEIRARWICPYACRIVRCVFRCVNVALL